MLPGEWDLFYFFRYTLGLLLGFYVLLSVLSFLRRVLPPLLHGDDPQRRLVRTYLTYALATVRLRPLAGELAQITFWMAVLALVWWAHGQI